MVYHLFNCNIWIFNNGFMCSITIVKNLVLQFNGNYGHSVYFWKLEKPVIKLCVILSAFMTIVKFLMNAADIT